MITDLLLAPDVIVDACMFHLADKTYENSNTVKAIGKAGEEDVRLWVYVGSVYVMHKNLTEAVKQAYPDEMKPEKKASEVLYRFTKNCLWLSALSEDGMVFGDEAPDKSQLIKGLERLGSGGFLMTKDLSYIALSSRIITPDEYLQRERSRIKEMAFVDLGVQQDIIRPKLESSIFRILRHGKYIAGPEIEELEEKLREFVGVKHAIVCSSGTDALFMTLLALGIGKDDAVFTVPFTFVATAEVIRLVGATPVFVDIEPTTFLMDPQKLEDSIKALIYNRPLESPLPKGSERLKPRAIITVDLFGCPVCYDAITAIARKYGLVIIEDAAQAFGATYGGKKAGGFGEVGCTSFFPAKPLGAYGDGGGIFTDSDELNYALKMIRNHGMDSTPYEHKIIGLNGRMDSIQAAVLLSKLPIFTLELEARRMVALSYEEALRKYPHIKCPKIPSHIESAWSQFSILTPTEAFRDSLRAKLASEKIPSAIYYPVPLHLQRAFASLGYKKGDFPVSEFCASRIISLPMHPYVKPQVIRRIAEIIGSIESY